jgi:hypothetical protein
MNGTQVTSSVGVGNVPTAWSIAGTGDFNGDGKSDIVWRDTGGNVAVWLMNGAQLSQSAVLGSVPTAWSIVETGDFNGDGKSDILWHDTSGNVAIWFMNGAQVSQSVGVGNVATVWSIQGAGADRWGLRGSVPQISVALEHDPTSRFRFSDKILLQRSSMSVGALAAAGTRTARSHYATAVPAR